MVSLFLTETLLEKSLQNHQIFFFGIYLECINFDMMQTKILSILFTKQSTYLSLKVICFVSFHPPILFYFYHMWCYYHYLLLHILVMFRDKLIMCPVFVYFYKLFKCEKGTRNKGRRYTTWIKTNTNL